MDFDELLLYRGNNIYINDKIVINHPTLDQIVSYGEQKYFNMIHRLCAVGADLKWELFSIGLDYTEVSDFDVFFINTRHLNKSDTDIVLGDIDLSKFELYDRLDNGEMVMYDTSSGIMIDRLLYRQIVEYLRKMHFLKRNDEIPYNNATKMALIEEAKDNYEMSKNKPYVSQLKNLVSAMVNVDGFKYNWDTVWNVKFYPFMDSVKRVSKIENARILLQSGYSGFGVDLKKIDSENYNWLGEL